MLSEEGSESCTSRTRVKAFYVNVKGVCQRRETIRATTLKRNPFIFEEYLFGLELLEVSRAFLESCV